MSQLNTALTTSAASVKEATKETANEENYLPIEVAEEEMLEFIDTLKKGVEFYNKITHENIFEHKYGVYYSPDEEFLYPTDKTNSNLLPDDYVNNSDEPEVFLEIVHKHEELVTLKQCSFHNTDVTSTIIDYAGQRFNSNDVMSKLKVSDAIYAALIDYYLINEPSVYDMPFVINLFLNAILSCYPFEERNKMSTLLKDALVSDMATIESTFTFTNCHAMELEDEELDDEIPY